ncbi:hypothetical protein E9993_15515 [Labilibacter sediminis]|nr:hypothetical protein E9993_15515 [Labilibacter sediminis]
MDLKLKLPKAQPGDVVYLCVLNYLKWKPVCGELVSKDTTVVFEKMGLGVVYLPQKFKNGMYYPVGAPFSLDKNGNKKFYSPSEKKCSFNMMQEDGYLIYRPNKKYVLKYWDNKWISLKRKVYSNTNILLFNDVPKNALYLMVPEYSWGKERPFTIDSEGNRIWW